MNGRTADPDSHTMNFNAIISGFQLHVNPVSPDVSHCEASGCDHEKNFSLAILAAAFYTDSVSVNPDTENKVPSIFQGISDVNALSEGI